MGIKKFRGRRRKIRVANWVNIHCTFVLNCKEIKENNQFTFGATLKHCYIVSSENSWMVTFKKKSLPSL